MVNEEPWALLAFTPRGLGAGQHPGDRISHILKPAPSVLFLPTTSLAPGTNEIEISPPSPALFWSELKTRKHSLPLGRQGAPGAHKIPGISKKGPAVPVYLTGREHNLSLYL